MNKNHIVVAGSILVDEINTVSKYPPEGELTQIVSVSKAVGGCVPNVAVDLKKIMPELKVSALGKTGDDENGIFVKGILRNSGVNTDMLVSSKDKTSFTQVISVSGGQRTFFTYPGASAGFGYDDIDLDDIDADILHLGYFLLLQKIDGGDGLKILKKAKQKGIETSIDLVSENSDRYKCVLPCLPFTDYLIINELEAGRLTGISPDLKNIPDIAKKLLDLGVNKKVIIHFPAGSVCADKSGNITALESYKLPKGYIKGTTGAGDAFCAGSLFAINSGLADREILEYGTVSATMALSEEDAVSGMTDIKTAIEKCRGFERNKL
ncbi:MAG: carbohydrate kinase family protein, partial [Clostridia bacterium]|nr:carbohydrate kinase family protein [Clostridia bacterium]